MQNDWVIKKTNAYKNFTPKLSKTISYDDGMFLLNVTKENPVICFFNSLFTISIKSGSTFSGAGLLDTKPDECFLNFVQYIDGEIAGLTSKEAKNIQRKF